MIDLGDSDFVELGRTFHDLRAGGDTGDDGELRASLFGREHLGWAKLAEEPRTVLLAEAGAGKTAEIRAAARRLRSDGRHAFFLRIEHITDHFEDAFEVGDHAALEDWLASDEPGWVFLDSVDEARLRSPRDFELAVKRLARALAPAMQRARILITGRTTAWRPRSDLQLVVGAFPYERPITREERNDDKTPHSDRGPRCRPAADEESPPPFRIVALDDLGAQQVGTFLAAKGVGDAAAFLDAVERADAAMFTARPQDLEELVDFWTANRRIGSRLEIMHASIQRRLAERDPDRAEAHPLSAERAMEGAMAVAAATTLTREPLIRIPDSAPGARGLALTDILRDWTPAECSTLAGRPVFDAAIYGSVRFHHRSVREYLTAEWIRRLLDKAGSRRRIEQLFFRRQYDLPVVVPSTRPILPWLAILDEGFLARVLEHAPEITFEGGDPRRLPPETRANVLREVCDQLSDPAHGRSTLDYAAVQRFAGADIAPVVRDLLRRHEQDDQIAWFLLRMVWHGELAEAAPEAKRIALISREKYARSAALRALRTVGTATDLLEVRAAIIAEGGELLRDWLDELLQMLPSDDEAVDWLASALAVVAPPDRFGTDSLSATLSSYIEALAPDQLAGLVAALADLLSREPVIERRHCRLSQRHHWLAQFAGRAIARLIEVRHPSALCQTTLETLRRTSIARDYHNVDMREARTDMTEVVRSWPEFNQRLFWHTVAEERAARRPDAGPLVDYWHVSIFGAHWSFDASYFDAVAEAARGRNEPDDRKVALSLAYRLYVDAGRPRRWRERLKRIATERPELADGLNALLRPKASGPSTWRAQERRWAATIRRREERDRAEEQKWREYLVANSEHITHVTGNGMATEAQIYLHHKLRDRTTGHGHWTDGTWESLDPEFGAVVARAFRDGAVAAWRAWSPPLLSEGKEQNTTPFASILGLTGLAIEFREDPGLAASLTPADAERAARYALEELNGFPGWTEGLYLAHPDLVARLVMGEIEHEVASDDGQADSHYALYRASWAGKWMWDRLGPALLELPNLGGLSERNLALLLKIVQGSPVTDARLAYAAARLAGSGGQPAQTAMWFAAWTGVEPAVAIPAFEAHLARLPDDRHRTDAAMVFATSLLGTRRSGASAREAFRTIAHVKSIYILIHRHIRQSEDIQRAGKGVYSPGLRDDSQDARNAIFAFLKDTPGKEAYLALVDLSLLHPDETSRPWMTFHAKAKAEQDADDEPWTLRQFSEFADALERTPANHRELWDLTVSRLLDLKASLEEGDDSISPLLMRAEDETELRNFTGWWCREHSHGRYSIPQEEELADAKRPDLRVHGAGFDAPVPVEIKLAERWTGPRLLERLENQLCGDYLRDVRSGRGVMLLYHRDADRKWAMPDGTKATTLDELVTALRRHWLAISERYPGVDEIEIVGLDLTRRTAARGGKETTKSRDPAAAPERPPARIEPNSRERLDLREAARRGRPAR